ncbi:MAG: tetratricopeptide repeat protein [Polyangiales bacterium]
MSVIDLHPDELIERARRGTLTMDERARLDEHLGKCVACRFECAVTRDFADESEIDGLSARVSDALRAAHAPVPVAPKPVRMPRWTWAAAAVVLFVSSGIATAQIGLLEVVASYVLPRVEGVFGARPRERTSTRVKSAPSAPRAVPPAPVDAPVAPQAPETSAPREPLTPPSVSRAEPARTLHRAPSTRTVRAQRVDRASVTPRPVVYTVPGGIAPPYVPPAVPSAPAPSPAPVVAPLPEPPATPAPVAARDLRSPAEILFAEANALRREGRARDAAQRYRELGARHPASAEARLSRVLLGRLELDRGEARAALASFEAYVDSGDRALREQALAGRALALARLGRDDAACEAFDVLLRAYPGSSYAAVARARCERD